MKKFLSIILSILLIISVVPMGLFSITANAATSGYYTYTVSNGEATITDCDASVRGDITIPSTLGGYQVTIIGEYAFEDCHYIKNVVIPNGVTHIDDWAFSPWSGSSWLSNVVIPDSVISIGEGAFGYCDNLRELQLPNSVKHIGGGAFRDCSQLTSITLPDQLDTINDYMFDGCTLLRHVYINSNILYVGDYAFRECRSLVNISLPRSVTYIGSGAFYHCVGLTDFVIPENVLRIGEDAFSLCAYLSRLTVPVSVKSIGEDAFSGSTNWLGEVCYGGNKSQRAKIEIGAGNDDFLNRFWIYKLCDQHTYQYACSEECSECHYNRTCTNHTYDNTCDIDCNTCGDIRTITHTYSNNCDIQCNVCGYVRSITHNYKWVIDKQETCGESGLKHEECTVCHTKRKENTVISATGNHTYDNECDTQCNVCEAIRTITHKYDNECDTDCNVCGYIRSTTHTYDSDNDLTCNICKYSRTPNKPTSATIRAFSIELEIVDGCEYSIDGITWQKEPLFVNLIPETEYSFYQRVKETASAKVSEKSEPTTVKTARAYTITYDANGGTDTPQLQLKDIGVDITLTNDKPIREGYTFIGWSTEKAGDVNFNSGDFYSIDKDLVLFAVWRVTCETCNGSGKVQGICDQCGGSGKTRFYCNKHDSATPYCADCGSRSYSFNPNFKCNDCYSTRMALYLCYYCRTQDGYWYVDCSKCISGVASVECEKCLGNGYEFDVFKILTHISINTKPSKLVYLEGDETLNTDGLVVYGHYDNDTDEIITSNYTITGYDPTPGTKIITVTHNGKTATFKVEVVAKSLASIVVTKKPNKFTYLEGEAFDKTGMVVTAYYNNNTSAAITNYTVSGYSSTVGTKTITVSYGGKTTTFTVAVNSRAPDTVTSSKHTINGNNISKISAGTTVSTLLNGLSGGEYCKVYKGNTVVSSNTAVGTGMVVKIMDGNTVKASYTVIVTGDTNGDGTISVTDMIAIKAHILNKSTLTGVYATAANTNGDSGISITDFIQVKAKILGKGSITAR